MYKMIVTDLDDTLLKTDKTVSQYTIDVLKDIRKRGKKVIFATARGDGVDFLEPHDLFDGCVLTNGARAYIGNKIVYESLIEADIYLPILRRLSELSFKLGVQVNGTHYTNFNANEKWENFNNFTITDLSNLSGSADKLYIVIDEPKQLEIIKSVLPQELYLIVSRDNLAMIMSKGATKSKGIAALADEFGILKDEIVVFGDDVNDIEMLKDFGVGVAMSNSIDEVKSIADYVCDTNDNDGVAKWLDENIGRRHIKKKMLRISTGATIAAIILGFILILSSYSIGHKMGDSAIMKNGGIMDTREYERIIDANTSNFKTIGIILSSIGGFGLIVCGYVVYKDL